MDKLIQRVKYWQNSHQQRNYYCTHHREPFYDIARKYLPDKKEKVIVDIGAGSGNFAKYIRDNGHSGEIFLLDANKETVKDLKKDFPNVIRYKAPTRLPFGNASVSFVHCSHLIEHLNPGEVYVLLREIDRIIEKGGTFVVSAPLLWSGFYHDMSHVRPYHPNIFVHYFTQSSRQHSFETISNEYVVRQLVYRYVAEKEEFLGSKWVMVDFFVRIARKILKFCGINKYTKSGYTIVLQKCFLRR